MSPVTDPGNCHPRHLSKTSWPLQTKWRFDKGILGNLFSSLTTEFIDSKFILDLNVKGMLWRGYNPKPMFQLIKLKKHSHMSAVPSVTGSDICRKNIHDDKCNKDTLAWISNLQLPPILKDTGPCTEVYAVELLAV